MVLHIVFKIMKTMKVMKRNAHLENLEIDISVLCRQIRASNALILPTERMSPVHPHFSIPLVHICVSFTERKVINCVCNNEIKNRRTVTVLVIFDGIV